MGLTQFQSSPVGADNENTSGGDTSGTGIIDLSVGETESITFDFTGVPGGDSGTFAISQSPSAGSFSMVDSGAGTASYSITFAQWQAAGSPSSVTMGVNNPGSAPIEATYSLFITCFAEGTRIATPEGEVPVEELAVGDLVQTADGRAVPLRWLGYQTISTVFSETPEWLRLVRIAAGALGGGLPLRDLMVTADHAMVVDGYLVNASVLAGRPGIDYVPMAELPSTYRIYHVELEAHEVILAEGAATESYVDLVPRDCFDNYAAYLELYGAPRVLPELDMLRISAARLLPVALRDGLAA